MSRPKQQNRLNRHRLYFFPALLPLVEIVPLVLTAIGGFAGLVGMVWKPGRKILVVALLCFVVAGGIVIAAMPDKEVRDAGSRAIAAENFPVLTTIKPRGDMPDVAPLPRFTDLWVVRTKNQLLSSPVISEGVLVVGTYKNTVEGYSIANGDLLWYYTQDEPMFTVGKGAGKTVYSGEGLHHTQAAALTSITLPEGTINWEREFLGHIESPPEVSADGKQIWLPTGGGGIWSVRADNGNVIWHQPVGHIDSTPLVAGGMLYAAAQPDEGVVQSMFFGMQAKDGKILFQTPLPGQPWGRPQISKDGRYIVTSTGQGQIGVKRDTDKGWAMSLDAKKGKLRWQQDLPAMPVEPGSYVADQDIAIYTLKNGMLMALRGVDGSPVWQDKIGDEFMGAARLIKRAGKPDMIAAVTVDGTFTIRDAATGAELMRRMVAKGASAGPVEDGDRIFVATPYRLYAFGGLRSL